MEQVMKIIAQTSSGAGAGAGDQDQSVSQAHSGACVGPRSGSQAHYCAPSSIH